MLFTAECVENNYCCVVGDLMLSARLIRITEWKTNLFELNEGVCVSFASNI